MIDLRPARTRRRNPRSASVAAVIVLSAVLGTGTTAVAFATTGTATTATAKGDSGAATFGIKPSHATLAKPLDSRSRFEYAATPGAVQTDYVAISNDATSSVSLSVYASDGFNTDSDGFDLLAASSRPVDVGAWITLKSHHVVIRARGTVVIPFVVRVPLLATPGDHVGGIVASLQTVQTDKKGDRVTVDNRVGTRVYMRIQGPLDPRLSISGLKVSYHSSWWNPFGSGKVTVSYTVHNPGNVRLGARQSVWVNGSYGGTVRAAPILDVSELLPGNGHTERVVISGVTRSFHERATVTVQPLALSDQTDGRLTTLVRTVSVPATPWSLMSFLALALLAPVGVFRRVRRIRRRLPSADAPGSTDAGQRRSKIAVRK